jgi:chemotaxis signal transduction protein
MANGQTGQARAPQLLVFTLAGLSCALPLADVQEVVPMALLSTPPGAPMLLDGFLNLRGALVAVVRTERLFGFGLGEASLQTRILILRGRHTSEDSGPRALVGLRIDSVGDIITEDSSRWSATAAGVLFNDCCVGQIGFGDSAIHVLSTERLLVEQESRSIAQLQDEMQNRLDGSAEAA